jgi:hypothetical protein
MTMCVNAAVLSQAQPESSFAFGMRCPEVLTFHSNPEALAVHCVQLCPPIWSPAVWVIAQKPSLTGSGKLDWLQSALWVIRHKGLFRYPVAPKR